MWTKDGRPGHERTIKLRKLLWVQKNRSRAENDHLTTIFVAPHQTMTSVTTGVIVLGPLTNQSERIAMTCSIDARWNDVQHSMIKSSDYVIGNVGNSAYAVLRGRIMVAKDMSLGMKHG